MITVLLTGNRDNLVQNSYQNRFAFATHAHTHSHTHTHPKKTSGVRCKQQLRIFRESKLYFDTLESSTRSTCLIIFSRLQRERRGIVKPDLPGKTSPFPRIPSGDG